MPRARRQKVENGAAIYHVMSRSISELDFFKSDEDKTKYMHTIVECKKLYNFKVYTYCLMDNHVHLIIDSNGANI
jgi:REP element-mobilizing transposase RayT